MIDLKSFIGKENDDLEEELGKNEYCHRGSRKKYKKCC